MFAILIYKQVFGVMHMQKVTDTEILKAINDLSRRGYPPSVREFASKVGYNSASTMHERLSKLKKQGQIQWEPTQVRTLRVVGHV